MEKKDTYTQPATLEEALAVIEQQKALIEEQNTTAERSDLTIKEQQSTMDGLEIELGKARKHIDEQNSLIKELSLNLEKANLTKSDVVKVVVIGDKKYAVNSQRVCLNGKIHTIEEVEKSKELQEALFEIEGQQVLTEI